MVAYGTAHMHLPRNTITLQKHLVVSLIKQNAIDCKCIKFAHYSVPQLIVSLFLQSVYTLKIRCLSFCNNKRLFHWELDIKGFINAETRKL